MQFPSKIFIDGGDPEETREADTILKKAGHVGVEGQTTNPTLIIKNVKLKMKNEERIPHGKAVAEYRRIVTEMARETKGPISIQVLGGADMTVEDMLHQARDRATWIPNAVVKFPCTKNGLAATEIFCQEGPVNITLTFSQEQAAAVYVATKAHNYDVFVSPFVGRLDTRGEKGMDVVANILEMYRKFGDGSASTHGELDSINRGESTRGGHVKVLTASVRTIEHVMFALWLKSDVISIPLKVLKDWAQPSPDSGHTPFQTPGEDYFYDAPGLTEIPYREMTLDKEWKEYDITHDLTDHGLAKFWEDWKARVE